MRATNFDNPPNQETIDEMIGPVCAIADLRPTNKWPEEWRALIGWARKVKKRQGYAIHTLSLRD